MPSLRTTIFLRLELIVPLKLIVASGVNSLIVILSEGTR